MRRSIPLAITLLLFSCGGPTASVASSSTPTPTSPPAATVASASPSPTYAPTAQGFESKKLVDKPRNLGTSAPGVIWIVAGASSDGTGVTAAVSGTKDMFTASYQVPIDRKATDVVKAAYVTPDLPPLPAGLYGESLTLVTMEPGGRSAAHMHSGIEGVLVLEGDVLVRTAGQVPATLAPGKGFYILPKTPIQVINVGAMTARVLVYSISPDGAPFSTPVDTAP